ncbi:hypothetical protein MLGJGCBP_01988 [Rhodococcus sp. T7]|nr:hypothetical protein MLGJGCBP_01988 [Rhodococcus sp. T7]
MSLRNREIVTWSGAFPAQITRNATSSVQARSICRDDRIPRDHAQISRVTSMSGSYPARPAPPVRRDAWNAEVSRWVSTISITVHTGWLAGTHSRMSGGNRNC